MASFPLAVATFVLLGDLGYWGGGVKSIAIPHNNQPKIHRGNSTNTGGSNSTSSKIPSTQQSTTYTLGKEHHHHQQNTRANSVSSGVRVLTANPTPQREFCRKSVLKMTKSNIGNDKMSTGSRTTMFCGCSAIKCGKNC